MKRRLERKAEKAESGGKSFEDMIAYIDEDGNITDTPPDPAKKKVINVEDIQLGAGPRDDSDYDPIRKGRVKFFNDDKGYGFILDLETQESVFVHINNTVDDIREGHKVIFEVEMGPKGPNAVNVKLDK